MLRSVSKYPPAKPGPSGCEPLKAAVYDPRAGLIVSRADPDALIPYNDVVFGVSRYEGE